MKQLLQVLVLCLCGAAGDGQALSFVYYEQYTKGSAAGELYVVDLAPGPFVLSTPDHPHMQVGIKRYGSRLLVTLNDIRWPGVLPDPQALSPDQLRVVIEQDGTSTAGSWPLVKSPPPPPVPAVVDVPGCARRRDPAARRRRGPGGPTAGYELPGPRCPPGLAAPQCRPAGGRVRAAPGPVVRAE